MPDLLDLCAAAVEAAEGDEQVEAFAEERSTTSVEAHRGEVEGLTFAGSRGVGVRLISDGRLGFAHVADPSVDEVRDAVARARENAAVATPDPFNALPAAEPIEPLDGLFSEALATMATDEKVPIALGMERAATTTDARVRKTEAVRYGDAVGAAAIASTEGVRAEYRGTGCWVVVVTLAEQDGDTQTGFSYRIARRVEDLDHDGVVAEAVQKQRSLFGPLVGEHVASDVLTVVDDGRLLDGPGAAPFDGEGVPTGRTELLSSGVLNGFLHNTYTARRGTTRSTGNAVRGYRSSPGVGTTNLFVQPGDRSFEQLLREAEGGVLVQEVTGVHSGANPISGEFSVGATGLRISGGALGEPVREMTIASTIPEMLQSVAALGSELRWFSAVGVPFILLGEMTLAGV